MTSHLNTPRASTARCGAASITQDHRSIPLRLHKARALTHPKHQSRIFRNHTISINVKRQSRLPVSSTADGSAAQPAPLPSGNGDLLERAAADWERTSSRLVDSATVPFVFLLLPQVIKNTLNVLSGNAQALVALSWVGFSMALAGNTMLLTYFVNKQEQSASLIQALGVGSNFVLLTQLRFAGFMPPAAFAAVAAAVTAATIMNSAKLAGVLERMPAGDSIWALWSEILGLVGLIILPQALWDTFASVQSRLPASAALGVASALFLMRRLGRLPAALQPLSANLLGWNATLLFMFQPLAQLLRNFAVPSSLAGVSLATVLLATTGNALMTPRALITNDKIWFLGSTWGSLFGWAQLLSLYLGRTAAGEMYIGHLTFFTLSTILLAYIFFVLRADARHKRVGVPFGSLRQIATATT